MDNSGEKGIDVNDLKYIKVEDITNTSTIITVGDVESYIELINLYKPDVIFVLERKNQERRYNDDREYMNYFVFFAQGVMYRVKGNKYKNIGDLLIGKSKGFQNGDEYYDAMNRGFNNYDEYKEARDLGYETLEDFLDSEKLGFRGCMSILGELDRFYSYRRNDLVYQLEWGDLVFNSEAEVYYYAKKEGFKDFQELYDAFLKGFKDAKTYHDAICKGFQSAEEYEEATRMGFDDPKEYRDAKKRGIRSNAEYDLYFELEKIRREYNFKTMDEAHVFKILRDLKPGKKISASKLWDELKKDQSKYYIDDGWYGRRLPKWYSRNFEDVSDLMKFLSGNKMLKVIGYYDTDGEVFERINQIAQDKVVIVDGSNVAWGSGSKKAGDKPKAENIKLVVDALKERGFKKIIVIIDASLNHQVEDPEYLLELAREKILKEAPAKRDADEFIIKYAKEEGAYIITNDTFKDWKEKDEWVKENIDNYRVTFMIIDGIVEFDEKIDKISG